MRALRTLALLVLLTAGVAATPESVSADPAWAPATTAAIHPGTMMYTDGAQCTANFVYPDDAGNVSVGYAAHCAGRAARPTPTGAASARCPSARGSTSPTTATSSPRAR